MAHKRSSGFFGGLLRFLIELLAAVVILYGLAQFAPRDMTITSIGSGLSNSLLITTPQPSHKQTDAPEDVTAAPTYLALTLITNTPEVGTDTVTDAPDAETGTGPDILDPAQINTTEDDISPVTTDMPEDDAVSTLVTAPAATVAAPSTASDEITTITISAAGDCTLGGDPNNGSLKRFLKVFDENGEAYFFESVADIFAEDDLTIVNLEGALTTETVGKDKEFAFRGNPKFGLILQAGNVDVVSLDNNHSEDYYSQGLADTRKTLDYLGIGYTGLGSTYTEEIKGLTVGFLSYRTWTMSVETMTSDIRKMRETCDLVIVSIHWGDEKVGKANATQIKLGHAAVDAGADLVLGHHPHVVGSIELYNGKYIAYSLGNFCFGGNSNPDDKDTMILQLSFHFMNGELKDTDISVIPCSISSTDSTNDYKPRPLAYEEGGKAVIKKIVNCSAQFESTPDWETIIAALQ